MKKIIRVSVLIFIVTMVVSTFKVYALHQVGVTNVTVPRLKGIVNAAKSAKEKDTMQRFQTVTSRNNSSGEDEVIEVRTYNDENGKYSEFIPAKKDTTVTIPNGYNTTIGVTYILHARNTQQRLATVHFSGVWIID